MSAQRPGAVASADPVPRERAAVAESVPGATPALRHHMAAHLDAASTLQAAIVQGRLSEARDTATWLARHDMDAPLEWQPYIDDLRYAALRVARAHDVAVAGLQLGRLGHACGACHEATGARPALPHVPAPGQAATLDAQMARHAWAAARLWEGLIGPADERWLEGARLMAATRLDIAGTAHAKPNAEVAELAEQLQAQAQHAVTLIDRAARAQLYGEMIDNCASCHRIVRPGPVAGGSR